MSNTIPGVYINHSKTLGETIDYDFASMFITFNIYKNLPNLITLNNYTDLLKYKEIKKSELLNKSIKAFFANKGKKLYILNYNNINKTTYFDIIKFEETLKRECDNLIDLEIISAINLYQELNNKNISEKELIIIQRTINEYAKKSYKISLTNIIDNFKEEYFDVLSETSIFHPWIKDETGYTLPSSVYATALLSQIGEKDNFFTSIANKNILNAIDVNKYLTKNELEYYVKNRINPVKYIPHQGIRLWGVKNFNSKFDSINELRTINYIKRNLYKIAKVYIFEPNTKELEDSLLSRVDMFLFKLWESGALIGNSKDMAYTVSSEIYESILQINVAVALSKPLEFIFIQLNKVDSDGTQSNLKIN